MNVNATVSNRGLRIYFDGASPLLAHGKGGPIVLPGAPPAARRPSPPAAAAAPSPATAASVPRGAALVGESVEQFRLERLLAESASWSLFECRHRTEATRGLAWVLDGPCADVRAFQEVCFDEANRIAGVKHGNLARTIACVAAPRLALLTECAEEATALADAAGQSSSAPSLSYNLQIARQIAEALARAHEAGVPHRSLSPDYVFVEHAKVKVGGFGWPIWMLDPAGAPASSLLYWSPERLVEPASAGFRSDLYGLGAILYSLLAGRPPASGDSIDELIRAKRQDFDLPIPGAPDQLADLVRWLLSPDPADRPGSYRLVFTCLEAAALAERLRLTRERLDNTLRATARRPVAGAAAGG